MSYVWCIRGRIYYSSFLLALQIILFVAGIGVLVVFLVCIVVACYRLDWFNCKPLKDCLCRARARDGRRPLSVSRHGTLQPCPDSCALETIPDHDDDQSGVPAQLNHSPLNRPGLDCALSKKDVVRPRSLSMVCMLGVYHALTTKSHSVNSIIMSTLFYLSISSLKLTKMKVLT